jgi:predicted nuclease with TOPRIM domain
MPMSQKEQLERKLAHLIKKKEASRDLLERLRQQGDECAQDVFRCEAEITTLREQLDGLLVANSNGSPS